MEFGGEREQGALTAGWAAVDVGFALGDGLGIGSTALETTARALCLRQQGINLFYESDLIHSAALRQSTTLRSTQLTGAPGGAPSAPSRKS